MIIVAGYLEIKPKKRDTFLKHSEKAVVQARKFDGCIDFSVSADLIEENRVRIFEKWKTKKALNLFRGDGPGADLSVLIVSASVNEYKVSKS